MIEFVFDNISEQLSLLVIWSSHHPVILGLVWLVKHNLQLDCQAGSLAVVNVLSVYLSQLGATPHESGAP